MTEFNSSPVLAARENNVSRGVASAHPIVISRAAGSYVWDTTGKKYLDFVGGIGVLNVGHNHPAVVDAIKKQVDNFTHVCFQVGAYEPYVELAGKLNALVGGGEPYKSVFLTTGAEAVENAIKIARSHTQRSGVIAFRGGFHGRTSKTLVRSPRTFTTPPTRMSTVEFRPSRRSHRFRIFSIRRSCPSAWPPLSSSLCWAMAVS